MRSENPVSLILASASPRRADLLNRMGFSFEVRAGNVEESPFPGGDPREYVMDLAGRKARSVRPGVREGIVIGADTIVYHRGAALGKPADPREAESMLKSLSGKTHEVFTGFVLIGAGGAVRSDVERTAVTFRRLESWEIQDYIRSGNPMDKAGAYGIQDRSGLFVEKIEGCFYNVVGFPVARFYTALLAMVGEAAVRSLLNGGNIRA